MFFWPASQYLKIAHERSTRGIYIPIIPPDAILWAKFLAALSSNFKPPSGSLPTETYARLTKKCPTLLFHRSDGAKDNGAVNPSRGRIEAIIHIINQMSNHFLLKYPCTIASVILSTLFSIRASASFNALIFSSITAIIFGRVM